LSVSSNLKVRFSSKLRFSKLSKLSNNKYSKLSKLSKLSNSKLSKALLVVSGKSFKARQGKL